MGRTWVAILLLVCTAPIAVGRTPPTVAIRMVDLAGLGEAAIVTSLDVTRAVFEAAGIVVTWRYCIAGQDDCAEPLLAHEIWLRIAPGRAQRNGWAGRSVSPQSLGFSVITQGPNMSVMSTVFAGQVGEVARISRIPVSDLLGQVVAHEVAHLLLGSRSHTDAGLMGARWSARTSHDRFVFTECVASELRNALASRRRETD